MPNGNKWLYNIVANVGAEVGNEKPYIGLNAAVSPNLPINVENKARNKTEYTRKGNLIDFAVYRKQIAAGSEKNHPHGYKEINRQIVPYKGPADMP